MLSGDIALLDEHESNKKTKTKKKQRGPRRRIELLSREVEDSLQSSKSSKPYNPISGDLTVLILCHVLVLVNLTSIK